MSVRDVVQAAAGALGGATYIEDVFSTYLYTGTGSTQTITNGIDLDGEGGLVWLKSRSQAASHGLFDTLRGANNQLLSDSTASAQAVSSRLDAFTSSGFTLGTYGSLNGSGSTYASWTFRKAEKFFDVVTYTGDGVNGRAISHALGSSPGTIFVKCTSAAEQWFVWHRSKSSEIGILNSTDAFGTYVGGYQAAEVFGNGTSVVQPTSTNFTVAQYGATNQSGRTYVAYLFAHDAGGFGDDGSENVISCGSYTGNGSSTGPNITLGWEPQWILTKSTSDTRNWIIHDNMRGIVTGGDDPQLSPNSSSAEQIQNLISLNATGYNVTSTSWDVNKSGGTYIYIAIRRGPMKTPTSGTEVFAVDALNNPATVPAWQSGFPVDMFFNRRTSNTVGMFWFDRLRGSKYLYSPTTQAEATDAMQFDYMNGVASSGNLTDYYAWMFRRAPGFFDVVCYTGNGPGTQVINHNLTVVPELVINKSRSVGGVNGGWTVFQGSTTSLTGWLRLNTDNAQGGDTLNVSSTTFTANSTIGFGMNTSGATYVTYLFATVAGVSKVGSYTGTGTTQQINCGFSGGARFVLIKRRDSTGDWYVWDSARGIVAGNDPYLLLNSTAAEVTSTDYVDTYSAGFEISSTAPAAINASGGTFIFLAIA